MWRAGDRGDFLARGAGLVGERGRRTNKEHAAPLFVRRSWDLVQKRSPFFYHARSYRSSVISNRQSYRVASGDCSLWPARILLGVAASALRHTFSPSHGAGTHPRLRQRYQVSSRFIAAHHSGCCDHFRLSRLKHGVNSWRASASCRGSVKNLGAVRIGYPSLEIRTP